MKKWKAKNRVIIMISDPWEFGTENGCGPFEGSLLKTDDGSTALRLDKPLTFKNISYEHLVVTSRYDVDLVRELQMGNESAANFAPVGKDGTIEPQASGLIGTIRVS